MMKQKSGVLAKFIVFVNLVGYQTELKVKRFNIENKTAKHLRSGKGSEYASNDYENCQSTFNNRPYVISHNRTE